MRRRSSFAALALFAAAAALSPAHAQTPTRLGVLMIHGKNPGGATDVNFSPLKATLERQGWLVGLPDFPWSRTRAIDGHWDQGMAEVGAGVKALRERGATKIVIVAYSMGVPAALGHAARGGDVQAMALLAPGHSPLRYYTQPHLQPVHDSINDARAKVAAGQGDVKGSFNDSNQSRARPVTMTAKDYLSYFDPTTDAEMSVTAPRVPAMPILTVVGNDDPLFEVLRGYLVEKLPPHPSSKYMEIKASHATTPRNASDEVVKWIKEVAAE